MNVATPVSAPRDAAPTRTALRVGLVLAGGGEVGISWHAAVLDALNTWSQWDPREADIIVGTSAGSWMAALLRAGVAPPHLVALAGDENIAAPDDILQRLGEQAPVPVAPAPWPPWPPASPGLVRRAARRRAGIRAGAVLSGLLPAGRLPSEPVVEGLERVFADRWPERPLWICAVNLDDGRRTVFGRAGAPPAHVSAAVAASCAVPAYFTPVTIGSRRYVDGGAHSAANLDVCAGLGLDLVIVSSPLSVSRTGRSLLGDPAARRYLSRRLRREAEKVRESGTPVVTIAPTPADLEVMGTVMQAMDRSRRRPVLERVGATMAERLGGGLLGRELAALRSG